MKAGGKTTEFGLMLTVVIGIFTLIGIGKLEADLTTLGTLVTLVLGYGAQRTILKVKENGNSASAHKSNS